MPELFERVDRIKSGREKIKPIFVFDVSIYIILNLRTIRVFFLFFGGEGEGEGREKTSFK